MFLSVVMPAFNAEDYIAQAIDSVLAQTHSDFELIIVNDGSSDNTPVIAENYRKRDPRVILIAQANQGTAHALNVGIAKAQSEWIAIMHADDVMLPNRLQRQIMFISQHPQVSVVGALVYYINFQGKIIGRNTSDLVQQEMVQAKISNNELIGLHHPTVLLSRSAVEEVGGYRSEFWPAEDCDLWNRIVEKEHNILVQPEYLLRYRIHGKAASVAGARLVRLKTGWIKKCVYERRRGKAEPSWQEYLDWRRKAPLLARLNYERKDLAKTLYKIATFHYASCRYHLFAIVLLAAIILQPLYVLRQTLRQLNKPEKNF